MVTKTTDYALKERDILRLLLRHPQYFLHKSARLEWNIGKAGYALLTGISFLLGMAFGQFLGNLPVGVLLGVFFAYMIPMELLERVEKKRTHEVREILIDAIRGIQTAYAVNHQLLYAIEVTLPTMQNPAKEAFQKVLAIERTGKPLSVEAIRDHFPIKELEFFIRSCDLIHETGGKNAMVLFERSIRILETVHELESELDVEINARRTETRYLFILLLIELIFFQLVGIFSFNMPLLEESKWIVFAMMLLNIFAWFYGKQLVKKKRDNFA